LGALAETGGSVLSAALPAAIFYVSREGGVQGNWLRRLQLRSQLLLNPLLSNFTMSAYASEYPSVEFDAAYKKFFEEFYATSDTPDAHEKYIENFTKDAVLVMASKKATGSDGSLYSASAVMNPGSQCSEILALRKGMWEKVASRKHKAIKIFPFGPGSDECMLYGTVQYGLKAGGESGLDWAARAHLVKDHGRVKMDFYQVYLVGTVVSERTVLTRIRILALKVSSQAGVG
jgi:hypothetical protein